MRKLAVILSMLTAVSALAAETWRWRDAEGVVHYSDRPVPGAERIDVNVSQRSSPEASAPPPATSARPPAAQPAVKYRCDILRPANDEVFNSVNSVTATVALEPGLQDGQRLQVYLNGAVYPQWPAGVQTYTLQELYRGSYTFSARVLDASGNALCTGPAINFHIRQPTLLSPARRPTPTPHGG
jgi:hypothetical protein